MMFSFGKHVEIELRWVYLGNNGIWTGCVEIFPTTEGNVFNFECIAVPSSGRCSGIISANLNVEKSEKRWKVVKNSMMKEVKSVQGTAVHQAFFIIAYLKSKILHLKIKLKFK